MEYKDVEDHWLKFKKTMGKDSPEEQIITTEKCYKAGYGFIFSIFIKLTDLNNANDSIKSNKSEEEDLKDMTERIACLHYELDVLANKYFGADIDLDPNFKHPGHIPKNAIPRAWNLYNKVIIKKMHLNKQQTFTLKIAFIAGAYTLFNAMESGLFNATDEEGYFKFLDQVYKDIELIGKQIDAEYFNDLGNFKASRH